MDRRTAALVAATVLMATSIGQATTECPCTVAQPIQSEDCSVMACPVTYTCFGDLWATPGWMVRETLAENCVGTHRGFENRNAANLAGFRLGLVERSRPLGPNEADGLFGDSLRIVLDVSQAVAAVQEGTLHQSTFDRVMEVTHACLLSNAALEYPRFRFLDIQIRGLSPASRATSLDTLAAFSGTFPVSPPAEPVAPN